MRTLLALIFATWCAASLAAETKVSCLTDRVWVNQAGAPPVVIVTFDEQANTAGAFVKDWGGLLAGGQVSIDTTMIMFQFQAASGAPGDITLIRSTGTLMAQLQTQPPLKFTGNCRAVVNRF